MKKLVFWLFLIVILLSVSCQKYQLDDVKLQPWSPELAAPLINSTFTVSDIFEHGSTSFLEIDENGVLNIVYKGTIFSFDIDDIINVGDAEMTKTLPYPNPGFPIPVVDTIQSSEVFKIDFNLDDAENVEVNELAILNGFLHLTLTSDLAFNTMISITIPNATKGGQPFHYEVDLLPGQTKENNFDMSDYVFDLTKEDLGYNQILIEYQSVIFYDPDIPAGDDQISITASFKDIGIDFVTGYFGKNLIALDIDTIDIDLFDNTLQGQFQFLDPLLEFTTINGIGLPVEVDVTEFKSLNIDDQTETELILEGITDAPFVISYPTVMGDTATMINEFTNENSNIETILNDGSKKIIWGLNATTNPDGPTSDLNFISHESRLKIETDVHLPLNGYAWDWVFTDTSAINVDENPEELLEITFRLILDNGFPADAIVQVYMTDSLFQLTDSLFAEPSQIFTSGIIDQDGIVIQPTKTITDIKLSGESITNLTEASNLIIFVGMETTNGSPPENQVIQIKDDYTLGFVLGLKAKVFVNPSDI